ncbi:MAG: vWA domain-containing protein [Lacipirellulaceae bacterium]
MTEQLFRSALSPAAWALLACVPPAIFALYFLKLKRAPLEVPSTLLWSRAIEDLRVNSLWQRLRRSVLLLLQLLVVGLAMLALLRPGWQGQQLAGERVALVIDHSASMQATDGPAGVTRLAAAKARATELVEQLPSGASAMVVAFHDKARVVQELTDNRRRLREAIASIEPSARRTDVRGALELVEGLATTGQSKRRADTGPAIDAAGQPDPKAPPKPAATAGDAQRVTATAVLLSDGRFAPTEEFAAGGLEVVYLPMGRADTPNLAVTALETRAIEGTTRRTAYVEVANYTAKSVDAVVELRLDGALLDAQRLTVAADSAAGIAFPIGEPSPGTLEARLSKGTLAAAGDKLSVDDVAYAAINPLRRGKALLVTPGNVALEQALTTARAKLLAEVATLAADAADDASKVEGYDVVIYDRVAPKGAPRANAVYVGVLPPSAAWRERATKSPTVVAPRIIDWSRVDPLLASVELGNFDVVESLVVPPPAGGRTLVDAAEGPIVSIAPRDAFRDLVIGFAILVEQDGRVQRNTDWINRHSFPTFWLNVLEQFAARSSAESSAVRPGEVVELSPIAPSTTDLDVTLPSGAAERLARRAPDPFVLRSTDATGVYRIAEGGAADRRVAVNLFDPQESDVRQAAAGPGDGADEEAGTAAPLRLGDLLVAASEAGATVRVDAWKPLLVAALCLVVAEWWVYHRRIAA